MRTSQSLAVAGLASVFLASSSAAQPLLGGGAGGRSASRRPVRLALDYETMAAARDAALRECGAGCSVVLTVERCGAYAADQANPGTADGWGESYNASAAARQRALSECRSRGGRSAWSGRPAATRRWKRRWVSTGRRGIIASRTCKPVSMHRPWNAFPVTVDHPEDRQRYPDRDGLRPGALAGRLPPVMLRHGWHLSDCTSCPTTGRGQEPPPASHQLKVQQRPGHPPCNFRLDLPILVAPGRARLC